jgi:predicted DNA-binding protein
VVILATKNRKQQSVYLSLAIHSKLKLYSKVTCIPKSRIVEKALIKYFEEEVFKIEDNEEGNNL